jgi:hypothetical protein
MLPRASISVVVTLLSSRDLLSMVAADWLLEKVEGRAGMCLAVWEKNRGDVGLEILAERPVGSAARSRVRPSRMRCRGLLEESSERGPKVSVRDLFAGDGVVDV